MCSASRMLRTRTLFTDGETRNGGGSLQWRENLLGDDYLCRTHGGFHRGHSNCSDAIRSWSTTVDGVSGVPRASERFAAGVISRRAATTLTGMEQAGDNPC